VIWEVKYILTEFAELEKVAIPLQTYTETWREE
jgi:hypothetical protein